MSVGISDTSGLDFCLGSSTQEVTWVGEDLRDVLPIELGGEDFAIGEVSFPKDVQTWGVKDPVV